MAGLGKLMRRKGGVYWYRRDLPTALMGRLCPTAVAQSYPRLFNARTGCFKTALWLSLGTTDATVAKSRGARLSYEVGREFDGAAAMLRNPNALPPALPPLEEIEGEHFRRLLTLDDEERRGGDQRHGLELEGVSPLGPRMGMGETHSLAYGDWLEEEAGVLKAALSRGDPSPVAGDIRAAFHRAGLRYDPEEPRHYDPAMAILRAAANAADAKLARQRGDDVRTPKAAEGYGPKLSEAFKAWSEGGRAKGGKKPSPNTLREATLAVRLFREWRGDKRLGAITKEDARDFKGALERRPTRLSAEQRALTLPELLKSKGVAGLPPSHGNTVNKLLTMLKAIVSHAEREGELDGVKGFTNPFQGVRSVVDKRHEATRKPFTEADLTAIFRTPVYVDAERPRGGGGEAAFWLPVLALLTGARQEELAQLRVCDVREEGGSWFLDVDTAGDRTVKTAGSRRVLPLHPEIIRMGFPAYVATRRRASATQRLTDPLWPGLESAIEGKRSAAWSKWFGRYLRGSAGVDDPCKVFHSFRHTFKRLCRDAGLTEEVHDALTGHVGEGVGRDYGKGFSPKALAREVARIEAPAALRDVAWGD
jgi:integrase